VATSGGRARIPREAFATHTPHNGLRGGHVIDNSDAWTREAEEVLKNERGISATEAVHFATSMLTAFYGAESPQLRQFQDGCEGGTPFLLQHHSFGAIRAALRELKAGLILNLRAAVAGEVLVEFLRLAKDILVGQTEEATHVAGVLVAAAYEGVLRRMGEEFAGVTNRSRLQDVIGKLKDAGTLKGGQVGTAQSYLKFRNDSLHADWNAIDRSQVSSCLAFTESLLLKHFS